MKAEFVVFGESANLTVYCGRPAASKQYPNPTMNYESGFPDQDVVHAILNNSPSPSIPYSFMISLFFLVSFLSATSTFILMGLREYIQEELRNT
jgi:hypothetical protein